MNDSRSRGQATIGVALIIALTLLGTVAVIGLGSTALSDIQGSSETGSAELALTQFDSRASQVALGDSESQTIDIGQTGGSYQVDPDAGHVRIVHENFDGQDDGNDETLYEGDLGTLYFERGDTTFAYQGGGVWRRSDRGGSTMVSPPEFHYRGSTLTFPIVRVNQDTGSVPAVQSGSGSPRLRVSKAGDARDIYANSSNGYRDTGDDDDGWPNTPTGGDGDGGAYQNPATNGTVVVYVTSEYYEAWADYFRTRTDGTVDTTDTPGGRVDAGDDPDGDGPKGVVAVELTSTGFSGDFAMPGEGSSIPVRGISDHSMSDFTITLRPDEDDEANFKNLQWSMYGDNGDREVEIHLRYNKNDDDSSTDCKEALYTLSIFYSPQGTDDYHGWVDEDAYRSHCVDTDGDGVKETAELTVDFVDSEDGDSDVEEIDPGDPMLEYQKLGSKNVVAFGLNNRDVRDPAYFKNHTSFSWENTTTDAQYSPGVGTRQSSDRLINHYFSLMGDGFDLTVEDKSSNTVQESDSSGKIVYTGADEFVTYMHITENDITVRID